MKFYAEKPDEIRFTLTFSMKLSEWKELQEQLDTKWPSASLSSEITDMIIQAEQSFYPKSE